MTYTPPPPAAQPPPFRVQPAGKDNTTLFGWIGIIFGILSIMQAGRWGKSPVLGIVAIVIGIITIIGWPTWWVNR